MLTIFNSDSLWIGSDQAAFHRIKNLLSQEGIPYKYKIKDHLRQWSRRGTIRGSMGSFGYFSEPSYLYEIFVHKKDFERASYLIR